METSQMNEIIKKLETETDCLVDYNSAGNMAYDTIIRVRYRRRAEKNRFSIFKR